MVTHCHDATESCCGHAGPSRREFLAGVAVAGAIGLTAVVHGDDVAQVTPRPKQPARVRAVFLYPPSEGLSGNPDGWWSWPGNDFDAEGRQARYASALREMAVRLGMEVAIDERPVASEADAKRLADELKSERPDGLLLMMFYNNSLAQADVLLKSADELELPAILYIGLGVKHGPVAPYRRPGVYLIQSLENFEAIESGLRMIDTKKRLAQSRLLSIVEAEGSTESVEPFLGIAVRVVPFARYAELFDAVQLNADARSFIDGYCAAARETRGLTPEAFDNATRAHLALKKLLAAEHADGLTMNCLRRGMLKPCMSFSALNSELIPAACENDLPAAFTQLLGQRLTGRPGFQHNPAFETERNHYYASHCTCPTKVYGPDGDALPFLLRRFAHSNEGSCAIQVFYNPGDPVTIVRYYPGENPALDVYAGKVVQSHPMPPAAGCTTNVEIEITDRPDACMVKGHHNLVFCGDYARRFRLFAQLYRMQLADTGYTGPWPA